MVICAILVHLLSLCVVLILCACCANSGNASFSAEPCSLAGWEGALVSLKHAQNLRLVKDK